MDVERTIDDIQQLEEMFEAPDIRHSAKAMCLPRIEGMMKFMQKVHGSGCGMISVFVADLSLPCSSCRVQTAKPYARIFADCKMSQTALIDRKLRRC